MLVNCGTPTQVKAFNHLNPYKISLQSRFETMGPGPQWYASIARHSTTVNSSYDSKLTTYNMLLTILIFLLKSFTA